MTSDKPSSLSGFQKIKSVTFSIVSPSICHEVMGQDAMILVFWGEGGLQNQLQMVIAAMKLKEAYSLEGKL